MTAVYASRYYAALCLVWLLSSFVVTLKAQTPATSLSGTVQSVDRQGVAKAAVTVLHEPSGLIRATTTDGAGNFAMPGLPAGGPYMVQVSQPGFKQQIASNVFLTAESANVLAFMLARSGNAPHQPAGSVTLSTQPNGRGTDPVLTASRTTSPAYIEQVSGKTLAVARPATPAPVAGEPPRTYRYAAKPRYTPRKTPPVVAPVTPGHYDARTGNYIYETGTPTSLKLANGTRIEGVGVKSTESLLHQFLVSPLAKVDTADLTKGWINFDRVFFEPGKATLTKESVGQLRNVAALMKAYPHTRIKIGGYSDSTGTYKVNRQLSDARARTAWAVLVDMGVSASRMEARGYGHRYAIANNGTPEGRAMNRRLSIKVLQK